MRVWFNSFTFIVQYRICYSKTNFHIVKYFSKAPSDVLRLRVTNKVDNRTETRNYTFDHLQDLQSRLMLVAGRAERDKAQGKDEVEKFTEVG